MAKALSSAIAAPSSVVDCRPKALIKAVTAVDIPIIVNPISALAVPACRSWFSNASDVAFGIVTPKPKEKSIIGPRIESR